MDEDGMDFGSSKNRNARTGRRAKKDDPEPTNEPVADEEETMTAPDAAPEGGAPDAPPRPSRRVGGWGEESGKSRATRRRRRGLDDYDDERLRPSSPGKDNDSDNEPDIPVIPDLEDQQDEEITSTVASAPNVAVNRVATYRELDNDLMRHAAFLTLDNEIDLKLLTKGLSSEADVQEEDKMWDWDRLFTEVTSELLAEEAEEITEEKTVGA